MPLDAQWAISELSTFRYMTEWDEDARRLRGDEEEIERKAYVVERILDCVLPGWAHDLASPDDLAWEVERKAAARAIAAIDREEELLERLGDAAPQMSAGSLHPWVWEPARGLWSAGQYRAAVHVAATALDERVRGVTGRAGPSGKKLFQEVLSLDPPVPGRSRLRVTEEDGTETYTSRQEGALYLGLAVSLGVRNVAAHSTEELDEQVAVEQLAALSLLARWIDGAKVVTADEP